MRRVKRLSVKLQRIIARPLELSIAVQNLIRLCQIC
jgi:hypothetical protein